MYWYSIFLLTGTRVSTLTSVVNGTHTSVAPAPPLSPPPRGRGARPGGPSPAQSAATQGGAVAQQQQQQQQLTAKMVKMTHTSYIEITSVSQNVEVADCATYTPLTLTSTCRSTPRLCRCCPQSRNTPGMKGQGRVMQLVHGFVVVGGGGGGKVGG